MNWLPARPGWRRCTAGVVLVGAAVMLAAWVDVPPPTTVRAWLPGSEATRWVAAAAALSVALVLPVPRSALSLLAGATFGVVQGVSLVLVGGLVGALGGFCASRWLGRARVTRMAGHRLARVDAVLQRHGLAAVVMARTLPAPPFAVVSYAAGLSGVTAQVYLAGTAIGLIPGSVVYVSIGACAVTADTWAQWLSSPWLLAPATVLSVAAATTWWRRRRRCSPLAGPD